MKPDPRKTLRPLDTPSPVSVQTDARGRPIRVRMDGARITRGARQALEVVQIRERWRIDDEWWREPVSRLYFEVILENGKRTVLYRDLVGGGWYR